MSPLRRFFSHPKLPSITGWLGVVSLGLYLFFSWWHVSAQPGGADSSGYFNMARALSTGQIKTPVRLVPGLPSAELPRFSYTPLGFSPVDANGLLTPTYPIGMPLFYAASAQILGWTEGPRWVMVLHGVGGVLLFFCLIRQAGGSFGLAWLGGAILAVAPLYLHFVVQAMSDVPATAWCLLALWLAGRGTLASAFGTGMAVGVATLIRPTNICVVLPVLIILGYSPKRWIAAALGGLPAAGVLLAFNHVAYGSPFTTGYGNTGTLFSFEWLGMSLRHYGQWVPMALGPIAILALATPLLPRSEWRHWLPHAVWVVVLFGFYAFYYHTHEVWWYLRFVLPAMPSLLLLSLLVLAQFAGKIASARLRWLPYALTGALCFGNSCYWAQRYQVHRAGINERIYLRAIEMVQAHVPANAIIMTMQGSGALYYGCPQTIMRWDTLDGNWPRIRAGAEKANRPLYALLFQHEVNDALNGSIPGAWTEIDQHVPVSLWKLDAGRAP